MLVRSYGVRATISNCSNNYGPSTRGEVDPPADHQHLSGRPKFYGTGTNGCDWIHVDDHNAAVARILTGGQIGRTYLIGADSSYWCRQRTRQPDGAADHPDPDRARSRRLRPRHRPGGHYLRYTIDPSALTSELGWKPERTDFDDGLSATIDCYHANESCWGPIKDTVEARYADHGAVNTRESASDSVSYSTSCAASFRRVADRPSHMRALCPPGRRICPTRTRRASPLTEVQAAR